MTNFIRQSALVLVLAVVFGSALALMYAWAEPLYKANQEEATIESISKTIPQADTATDREIDTVELANGRKVYKVLGRIGRKSKGLLGWAYVAKGKGFGGDIKLLIGLSPKADSLVGIDVLEDVETPGFGNSINDEKLWKSKFRPKDGKALPLDRPLVVVKKAPSADKSYKIQAITGATISSKAVVSIINQTVGEVAEQIKQED